MDLPSSDVMMSPEMAILVKEEWHRSSPSSIGEAISQEGFQSVHTPLGVPGRTPLPLQLSVMNIFTDPDCPLSVGEPDLSPPAARPAPESFRCQTCGKVLSCAGSLRRHQVTHSSERPHCCQQCGRAFSTAAYLAAHGRTHSQQRPHACPVCGKGFTRSTGLHRHLELHDDSRLPAAAAAADLASRQQVTVPAAARTAPPPPPAATELEPPDPAQCGVCGKHFTRALSVKAHMRIHTGERPHKCPLCDKAFKNASHLKVHSRTHTKERRHRCAVCGKGFAESSSVRRHMLVHTGERPYECDLCGQAMRYLSHLKAHRRKHTGETPYQCATCSQTFRLYQTYRLHVRKHNGQLPTCNTCGKTFSSRARLEDHELMHAGVGPQASGGDPQQAAGKRFALRVQKQMEARAAVGRADTPDQ